MKLSTLMAGLLFSALASAASGAPQEDAVKAVVKAVQRGDDLGIAFPGAISAREVESLRRVSKCTALNLMKQEKGRYTVVWHCGSKGALGMEVRVSDSRITSISTMEVTAHPTRE
ncbi:MAG TPA: hypothetical protein VFP12_16815 [Allosphingosinicella sp.]|nr:hypothetical protein [Allosphingosinicella sp.]